MIKMMYNLLICNPEENGENKTEGTWQCCQCICFRSSINSRAGRERVRCGWGGGEARRGGSHYLGSSAVKSAGIAFITEPK